MRLFPWQGLVGGKEKLSVYTGSKRLLAVGGKADGRQTVA